MPVNFEFTATDAAIITWLTVGEISRIATFQAAADYTFEFHGGHTTGNPIYVRPTDNTDTSNLPKIDTRNKLATDYAAITDLANGEKLQNELAGASQTEILNIAANDWWALQLLAE